MQLLSATASVFLCLMIFTLSANAESIRFKALNASNGLPQNSIRDIVQDHNGMMWFATEDGIVRYDGHEMDVHRFDPNLTHPIPDNVANRFILDSENRLWMTLQGEETFTVLDQNNQNFYSAEQFQIDKSEIGEAVALYKSSDNHILVGTDKGIFKFSTSTLSPANPTLLSSGFSDKSDIATIWEDNQDKLWAASRDGQLGYITGDKNLNIIETELNQILNVKRINGLGDVIIAGRQGLFEIEYEDNSIKPLFSSTILENRNVRDIVQDKKGNVWIATKSGLIRYNKEKNIAEIAEKNTRNENSLPTNELTKLYISKEEILWIGTTDKGVLRTNLKDYGFDTYSSNNLKQIYPSLRDKSLTASFKSDMIWSIYRDSRETLWIGHTEGVSKQEKGNEAFTDVIQFGEGDDSVDISESWIMSIHETKEYLWFGTWGEGLIRYSPTNKETTVFSTNSTSPLTKLSGDVIRLILWDENRQCLWVGTHHNGLDKIDAKSGLITNYQASENDNHSLPHNRTRSLYLDNLNRLWVGTGSGLALYNDKQDNFDVINKFPEGHSYSDVRGVFQSGPNTLWASNGYGLDKINISELAVEKRFLEEDGLSRSALYGIEADNNGVMWIPTIRGLTRFNPASLEFKSFYLDHNIQSDEFNFNASWTEADGSIIVGGVGGITKFNPSDVDDKYEGSPPVILSVKAVDQNLNEVTLLGIPNKNEEIQLTADQRSIIIDFVSPEYAFQENKKYQYKLIGHDNNWINALHRDTPIRYTNLSSGKFDFQVRAVDSTTEENEITSIGFEIGAHLWEQSLFQVLTLLATLMTLAGILKYKLEQRLSENLSRDRSNLYSMVVHELAPYLKRSQEHMDRLTSHSNSDTAEIFSELSIDNRYALSFVEQLHSISTVEGYTKRDKQLFLLEEVWDEIVLSSGLNKSRIKAHPIPDVSVMAYENSIQFIVRNLISNAAKYSEPDSPITVEFKTEKNDLYILVADQGYGVRDQLKEKILNEYERGDMSGIDGLGIGLTLVNHLIAKFDGTIKISDNTPKGSIVEIHLKKIVKFT